MGDVTFVELVTQAIDQARARLEESPDRPSPELNAKREYALAITHLEDARMRFTRGRAMDLGQYHPADLDRSRG